MKHSVIANKNSSITTLGERVVVAGGTQGIGEGIACRFAQAGAEVWIVGRNESKGPLPLIFSSHKSPYTIMHLLFSESCPCTTDGNFSGEEDPSYPTTPFLKCGLEPYR